MPGRDGMGHTYWKREAGGGRKTFCPDSLCSLPLRAGFGKILDFGFWICETALGFTTEGCCARRDSSGRSAKNTMADYARLSGHSKAFMELNLASPLLANHLGSLRGGG